MKKCENCKKLKMELKDLNSLFSLQHTRTVKADRLWQKAHKKPNVLPDLGELVQWLMDRVKGRK